MRMCSYNFDGDLDNYIVRHNNKEPFDRMGSGMWEMWSYSSNMSEAQKESLRALAAMIDKASADGLLKMHGDDDGCDDTPERDDYGMSPEMRSIVDEFVKDLDASEYKVSKLSDRIKEHKAEKRQQERHIARQCEYNAAIEKLRIATIIGTVLIVIAYVAILYAMCKVVPVLFSIMILVFTFPLPLAVMSSMYNYVEKRIASKMLTDDDATGDDERGEADTVVEETPHEDADNRDADDDGPRSYDLTLEKLSTIMTSVKMAMTYDEPSGIKKTAAGFYETMERMAEVINIMRQSGYDPAHRHMSNLSNIVYLALPDMWDVLKKMTSYAGSSVIEDDVANTADLGRHMDEFGDTLEIINSYVSDAMASIVKDAGTGVSVSSEFISSLVNDGKDDGKEGEQSGN